MTNIETSFDLGIGILGVGAMAEAMVTGLCEERDDAPAILLSPRSHSRSRSLASRYPSVHVASDNWSVVSRSRTVVLSIRPQDADAALRGVAFRPGHVVISVIAGVPVTRLRELVAPATEVAHAIPLPAIARRQGLTAIHPPSHEARGAIRPPGRDHPRVGRGRPGGAVGLNRHDCRSLCLLGDGQPLAHRPGHQGG